MKRFISSVITCFFFINSMSQPVYHVIPAFEELAKFNNVRDLSLTADGNECFFTVQSPLEEVSVLMTMKLQNGKWSEPIILPFSGMCRDLEPFVSQDGLSLYFVSNRALDGSESLKDYDIWLSQRDNKSSEWKAPVNLGKPINTEYNEFFPAIAANKNLYFCSDKPGGAGKDDIYYSNFTNKGYTSPTSLGESINTEGYEYNAFIAPDESFIIFGAYNRKDGYGSGDLYISTQENGVWSAPVNLGEPINSTAMDYCPFVDFSSNTLYFTSRRSNIKQNVQLKSIVDVQKEFGKYENGFSRLYKTAFNVNEFLNKK